MVEKLILKWGTLKGWDFDKNNEKAMAALKKYHGGGVSVSAMMQRDSEAQKEALLELIEAVNGRIINDWEGKEMTKEEAKEYVMTYRD